MGHSVLYLGLHVRYARFLTFCLQDRKSIIVEFGDDWQKSGSSGEVG